MSRVAGSRSRRNRPSTSQTIAAWVVLIFSLAVLAEIFAGQPWDKRPDQWTLAEATQILDDSPWSPAKTVVEFGREQRYIDPVTRRAVPAPQASPPVDIQRVFLGRASKSDVPVLWWSAKTTRLARQRLQQLRDPAAPQQPLRAEEMKDFVLVVEGSEALRILRDAVGNLRDTVYFELPGGMTLDVAGIRFREGESGAEDSVEFHFPRELNGQPTIASDAEHVVFHCKATAKTARAGRPNAISIRAPFEPRKMRARSQSNL